ncbi:ArsR/SmtB family transcription factor [Paractinoplanes brasiliensis]|uniref:Helix-turn-helix protein n=1 Tax=Paractinoplanes brasiliensis TaxID=52695 RepID=A0A4R6JTV7_9ACTN|nr:helix-turn-helix domain-containing protein [Actinoplanes brasiliensis]TDO39232.1 helix-turn-helix protein [Actinoplanes brasiliensis]GID30066.1 transcriptional regulator [Actinoplanes brasiliensis]
MRALAHPARIAIVEYLNSTGAVVTATECAELVGLSPSATSYHLRELARYGLVEHAPSRGDGRERVWQGTGTGLRIDADQGDPETVSARSALVDVLLERDVQRARQYLARAAGEPEEWRETATLSSRQVLLTADELRELNEKVSALVEPYRVRRRQGDPPAGARRVQINYTAYPDDVPES